jgi:15-cis-phytoene synthase
MIDIADPERRLSLAYAPSAAREALAVLFALDERMAQILVRTREPMIGLMRLVWWRDALIALDGKEPPAEPLLQSAGTLRSNEIMGAALGEMVEGWEALLDDPDLNAETMAAHSRDRGGRLFRLAAQVIGADDARLDAAGAGWAMADRARHAGSLAEARAWLDAAKAPLAGTGGRWPRALRPLGMLAALARQDVARGAERLHAPGDRARLLRILAHQLTGR